MPLNSPCWDFVTQWKRGACPPAPNGPMLPTGVLWVTKQGPWLDAWPSGVCVGLGAGSKVLPSCASAQEIGRRPKSWPCSWGDSLGAFR